MRRALPRLCFGLPLLGLCCSCTLRPEDRGWTSQLSPAGPCWEVDLSNGLDEAQTHELHALYSCLDQSGSFRSLREVDAAMEATTRADLLAGQEVAGLVNGLPELGLDLFGLAGAAIDLLDRRAELFDPLLQVGVELIYARSWASLVGDPDLADPSRVEAGLVAGALPLIPSLATELLDDPGALRGWIRRISRSRLVSDGLCTFLAVETAAEGQVAAAAQGLLPHLGLALDQVQDTGNDRWSGASGDSLRDLVVALIQANGDGQTLLAEAAPTLQSLLADEALRDRLGEVLSAAEAGGHLDPLPAQIRLLAATNNEGAARSVDEDSALHSLLRLLEAGNSEVVCSIDLGITVLEIDLGNLSVSILHWLGGLDPSAVEGGVSVLGDVLGWGFSQSTLEWVADTGVCPVLDTQLVADLGSIDRLTDDDLGDLLVVLLDLLAAFAPADAEDRTPELVDLLSAPVHHDLVPPLEELLIDLGDSALMDDLTDLAPLILDPTSLDTATCPAGAEVLGLDPLWGLGAIALQDSGSGSAVDALAPISRLLIEEEATWTTLSRAGELLRQEEATLLDLPQLLVAWVSFDPELEIQDSVADLLDRDELLDPILRLAETRDLTVDALGGSPDGEEGPLAFAARLVIGGTLEAILSTVDLLVDSLSPSGLEGGGA